MTLLILLAFLPVVAYAAPAPPSVLRSPDRLDVPSHPAALLLSRHNGVAVGAGSDTPVAVSNSTLGDNVTTAGYAPERVACANGTVFVRPASDGCVLPPPFDVSRQSSISSLLTLAGSLNEYEQVWVSNRLASAPFAAYLASINLTATDLNLPPLNDSASSTVDGFTSDDGSSPSNTSSTAPVIGLAFSGGGLRALVSGGGQLYGLDPRNVEAQAAGTAFLPAVAYIAGLSGGSWLVASSAAHAPENVSTLELAQNQWNLSQNLVTDAPQPGLGDAIEYYTALTQAVGTKADNGFPIGLTDYWVRFLSIGILHMPSSDGTSTHRALRSAPISSRPSTLSVLVRPI